MRNIPFLDLAVQNRRREPEFQSVLSEVLSSGIYLQGEKCKHFEEQFAEFCDTKYCVSVGSGLDALTLALESQIELGNLKEGAKVAVQATTFVATFISIIKAKLIPVPIDVGENSLSVEPAILEQVIEEEGISAFVSVHLYGYMHETKLISEICENNGILFFEDAAQAHGAKFDNVPAGAWSVASAFSFYPGKNLGALGDGGAIATSDKFTYEIASKLRNYGSSIKYHHELIGTNSRLDEIQAGFLSIKLKSLQNEIESRRRIAARYDEEIKNKKIRIPSFKLQSGAQNHAYHLYVVNVEERSNFMCHLEKHGIQSLIHYPIPAYRQQCFNSEYSGYQCNVADKVSATIVSIPLYGSLESSEIDRIINACNKY